MPSLTSLLSTSVALAVAVSAALPDVTPIPLPKECKSYPDNHDSENDRWNIYPAMTGTSIDGNGATIQAAANSSLAWGVLSINPRPDMARLAVRCANSTLVAWSTPATDASGVSAAWAPLGLSSSASADGGLRILIKPGGTTATQALEPYHLRTTADGKLLNGTYLGLHNATTWAFHKGVAKGEGSPREVFEARLLVPGAAKVGEGESVGFLGAGFP